MSVLVVGGVFREIRNADTAPCPRMGGSGLTAALVAAQLGAETQLASFVGSEDAETVAAMLDTAGIDRSSLFVLPGSSGTFVFPTRADERRPWPMYRPAEAVPVPEELGLRGRVVLVFGMPDFDALAGGWVAPGRDDLLIWDRQGFMSRARDWRGAAGLEPAQKIYVANLDETLEEFPAASTDDSLAHLPPPGFSAAAIKLGGDGCLVLTDGVAEQVAGFPRQVESTIGSGDAFAGAFAAGIDDGLTLVDAAFRANAAAAAYLDLGNALDERLSEYVVDLIERRA